MRNKCIPIINYKINYQSPHSTQVTGTLIYAVHSVLVVDYNNVFTSNHHKKVKGNDLSFIDNKKCDTYNLQSLNHRIIIILLYSSMHGLGRSPKTVVQCLQSTVRDKK